MDSARQKIRRACELLSSPTPANLESCSGLLQSATGDLTRIQSRAEAIQVLSGLRQASALLESAAQFHRERQQMMNVLCVGYEPGGEASSLVRRGNLSLAG